MSIRGATAAAVLTLTFLLIYLPDVGGGFIRDDFMWVHRGQIASAADVARVFRDNTGFYRPLVTLSFGLDQALFGLRPFPYALTNVGLLLACALLVARLGYRLGLPPWAAGAAAALWAFNFHGVNMALLWISGRTALLLCLFALLATLASLRRRWWRAGFWCLLALLSKEEAVTLPFLLVGWAWYSSSDQRLRSTVIPATAMVLGLAVYALLRVNSGAFGPVGAPYYYQFTFAPWHVARNVLEYVDRAATFVVAVTLVAMVIVRTKPRWMPDDRRTTIFAAGWFVAGFAITVFLPLRSSLYALYPSIGVAILGANVLRRLRESTPQRMRVALPILVLLPVVLIPIYWQRNVRWVEPASASYVLVGQLHGLATSVTPEAHLLALDRQDERLDYVFSGLFSDAVSLYVAPGASGEIIPASEELRWSAADGADVVLLRLLPDGRLIRTRVFR